MIRPGDTEKVDRPECETVDISFIEQKLDLLIAIAPFAGTIHSLKAFKVGRARTEKNSGLIAFDGYLRGDNVRRPFDPVPPSGDYQVGRIIRPVGFAIPKPCIVAENLIFEHDER